MHLELLSFKPLLTKARLLEEGTTSCGTAGRMLYQWPQSPPGNVPTAPPRIWRRSLSSATARSFTAENKTFNRQQEAFAWAHEREKALKVPGALDQLPNAHATLATAIDRYVSTSVKEIGRTKAQVLRTIKTFPIADLLCSEIHSPDVIELATALGKTRTPQTVANYLSHLGAVFAVARPAWGYPLDDQVVRDAFRVSKRMGITGKSVHRDRRPTLDELDLLTGC